MKIFTLLLAICALSMSSCSSDEPAPRSENDICGAWKCDDGNYFYFKLPNICYKITVTDPERPQVDFDAYYYEPGYNFLLYVNIESQPDIYQVTSITNNEMTWVWADNLLDDKYHGMSKSEILGEVISQAQEGFDLDYSRTYVFTRLAMEEFDSVLISYGFEGGVDDL